MDYLLRRYLLPPEREPELVERLALLDFTSYALSSRRDALLDLTCYGVDARLPGAVVAVLRELVGEAEASEVVAEAELLAGLDDGAAVALAPGVQLVPETARVDSRTNGSDALTLHIPPGPAFGDGKHVSTCMAAELLLDAPCRDARVLDLGCGSGVLGIAALGLGARSCCFVDCDAAAVDTAAANVARNACAGATQFAVGDLLDALPPGATFDVIVGNLYADLVHRLLADPRLAAVLPRGELLLSGIAYQAREAVLAALRPAGFTLCDSREAEWWCAFRCRRDAAVGG